LSDKDVNVELGDRVVNRNSDFARLGRQHILLVKDASQEYPTPDARTSGVSVRRGTIDEIPTSPANSLFIGINMNYTFNHDFDVTVAHEMAHGCGVLHHGGLASLPAPDKNFLNDDTIYAWNMTRVSGESLKALKKDGLFGLIAGAHSQSSGDVRCIMRYSFQYVWAAPLGAKGKVYINVDGKDTFEQNLFCNSRSGTFFNASSHKPYPVYGDADKGDCIHQFQVKDW
jgi:hypothetical protein